MTRIQKGVRHDDNRVERGGLMAIIVLEGRPIHVYFCFCIVAMEVYYLGMFRVRAHTPIRIRSC